MLPNLDVTALDATLGWRPDELVHLELKADRESVRDNSLGQFQSRERRLSRGHFLQRLVLLLRRERRDPGEKQRAYRLQVMRSDLFLGPRVVFISANNEFDFI